VANGLPLGRNPRNRRKINSPETTIATASAPVPPRETKTTKKNGSQREKSNN
jgi:hypothetical protein